MNELGVCTQGVFGSRALLTPEHIRQVADTGIRWIEIGGPNRDCFNYGDDAYVDAIGEAVRECGLNAWSMHGPFCPVALDDPDTREKAIQDLISAGCIASKMGAGRMVIHPGRDVPTVDRDLEIAYVREAISRALDAVPSDLILAVETVRAPWLGMRCDDILRIVDGFDPARVGICLDTGHWHSAGHLIESMPGIVNRIVTCHLHDNGGGEKDEHLMPGDGTIDWGRVIGVLRKGGYAGPFMLEARVKGMDPAEYVEDYTRRMAEFTEEETHER